ncbi:hypothetical protein EB061_11070 [bacterium]|nr:hypothetical protein [bacterium]
MEQCGGRGGAVRFELPEFLLESANPFKHRLLHPGQLVPLACKQHHHPSGRRLVLAENTVGGHRAVAFRVERLGWARHVDDCLACLFELKAGLKTLGTQDGNLERQKPLVSQVLEASLESGWIQALG